MTARSSGSASASARNSANETPPVRARDVIEVGAERIVELPALHLRRRLRRERLLRPEPRVGRDAGDGVARAWARRANTLGVSGRSMASEDMVGSLSSPSPGLTRIAGEGGAKRRVRVSVGRGR